MEMQILSSESRSNQQSKWPFRTSSTRDLWISILECKKMNCGRQNYLSFDILHFSVSLKITKVRVFKTTLDGLIWDLGVFNYGFGYV